MPAKPRCEADPFKSPIKAIELSAQRTTSNAKAQHSVDDVLATADLFLEQLKELEDLCSTVEERVQRKRQALKELEYLIMGLNSDDKSPYSPACPTNTPINSRLSVVSPRLRGLFDIRGPSRANLDAIQTCLDYSPETRAEVDLATHNDPGHSEEWVDDEEEEALLSPFDDRYALEQPAKVEKDLPAIPHERTGVLESKIPRKVHVRRQASASRRTTGRSADTVVRSTSRTRRLSVRNVKANAGATSDVAAKGTMRRGSWKRSIENARKKGGLAADENQSTTDNARKKEKKGLWSIYSVCSDLGGLNSGTHYYHAI